MRPAFGRGFRKWEHVASDCSSAADIGVGTDAHKLMHRTEGADHRPFFDGHMPAQGGSVGQDGMVSYHAIVGHVGVSHDQDMATDPGPSAAFDRATIQRGKLSHHVIVAHFEPGGFTLITQILGCEPNRGKGEKAIASADQRWAPEDYVRNQLTVFPQLYPGTHGAIGAYAAGGRNFGCRVENGCGMNTHRGGVRGRSLTFPLPRLRPRSGSGDRFLPPTGR